MKVDSAQNMSDAQQEKSIFSQMQFVSASAEYSDCDDDPGDNY